MTTYVQPTKKLVDVGEVGNANTGDIIYDGGVKLNDGLTALYNTFGDVRLWDVAAGVGSQKLHATGYYQKNPTSYYARGAVDAGSMHDLNTISQTFTVSLPTPKIGECVEFINSNGSYSVNKIVFRAQAGGDIAGSQTLEVSQGSVRIVFICVDETAGSAKWNYMITPMFGDFTVPANTTVDVAKATPQTIPLFNKALYDGVKLVMSAHEVKAGVRERTLSEVLLMVDPDDNKVYADEYSVL
ncbi:MAG: hypothetical protein ACRC9Y_19160, partial [Aeromonas veronii]